jgi:inorganic pyrophosphatase
LECQPDVRAGEAGQTSPVETGDTGKQIEHFFAHYKDLEERKWFKPLGWGDAADAKRIIVESIDRARIG